MILDLRQGNQKLEVSLDYILRPLPNKGGEKEKEKKIQTRSTSNSPHLKTK